MWCWECEDNKGCDSGNDIIAASNHLHWSSLNRTSYESTDGPARSRMLRSDSSLNLNISSECASKKLSTEKDVHSTISTSKQVIVLPVQNQRKNVTDKVAQVSEHHLLQYGGPRNWRIYMQGSRFLLLKPKLHKYTPILNGTTEIFSSRIFFWLSLCSDVV